MSLNAGNLGWSRETEPPSKQRVVVYIDGFNLYFGLKESGWKRYYWLNVYSLAQKFLGRDQYLAEVKYFTSRISGPSDKRERQNVFLEALGTIEGLDIQFGQFYSQPFRCPLCRGEDYVPAEKMTDVNIATALLTDAFQGRFQTAILVSADSDLVPPIRSIRSLFPNKRLVVAFPPRRNSALMRGTASGFFHITKEMLRDSQLPDTVIRGDGFRLQRPQRWG